MAITFGAAIDMDGNPIENVEQLNTPNSVVTVGKLETDLSAKANAVHLHDMTDIQGIDNIFQDITLDGGVL
jgi:hypothetical protein